MINKFLYITIETYRLTFVSSRLSKSNKRIIYTVLEYSPLLDSSNMTTEDWGRIGKDIEVLAARSNSLFDGC